MVSRKNLWSKKKKKKIVSITSNFWFVWKLLNSFFFIHAERKLSETEQHKWHNIPPSSYSFNIKPWNKDSKEVQRLYN